MTYIKRVKRVAIDPIIDGLVKRLRSIDADRHDVAYAVTRVAMEALRPQVRWTRQSLSDCADALYAAAAEIENRMVQSYTEAEIRLNGDLECFQDGLAALVPLPSGGTTPSKPDTFNVIGNRSGRFSGAHENPCVEVTNSLAPVMSMSDLGVCGCGDGELKPVSEALSDEQIKAVEEDHNSVQDTE
jgi:hypothetical protein